MSLPDLVDIVSKFGGLVLSYLGIIVAALVYLRRGKLKLGDFSLDFSTSVEQEVAELRRRISEEVPEATPAEKQYVLLREYHTQGLAQSKVSFWFSLVFASIGFAVIIVAILTVDRGTQLIEQAQAFVSLASGTIIESVSALFFVQSNRARQLMTEFFDRLRIDKKLEESLKLVETVPDETLRSRLQVLMALNFAQVNSSDSILKMVMDLEDRDSAITQVVDESAESHNRE